MAEFLAIFVAVKDGYIDFNPNAALPHKSGWADISAGIKYALIDDRDHEFILTPGLKFEIPTGNQRVFQGNGSGEWNAFISAAKGWNRFHVGFAYEAGVTNPKGVFDNRFTIDLIYRF